MSVLGPNSPAPYEVMQVLTAADDSLAAIESGLEKYPALLNQVKAEKSDEGQRKKIKELGLSTWQQCKEDLDKQRKKVSLDNIQDYSSAEELSQLAKTDAEFQSCVEKTKKFLSSKLARLAIPDSERELRNCERFFSGSKAELETLTHLNRNLQQLFKENPEFAKTWNALSVEKRNKILGNKSINSFYRRGEEENISYPIIKIYLVNSVKWEDQISKFGLFANRIFDEWVDLYFKGCKGGAPERALNLVENALQFFKDTEMNNKQERMSEFLRELKTVSILIPWSVEDAEKKLSVLKKMCCDERIKPPKYFYFTSPYFAFAGDAVKIYQYAPSLYLELVSEENSMLPHALCKHIEHVPEKDLIALKDLTKQFDDSVPAMEKLLECSSQTLKNLCPFFQWLVDEIKKDNSKQRLEQLNLLFDKVAALQLDQPKILEMLSAIPVNKSFVWEMILKDVEYTSTLTIEDVKKTLKTNNEEQLSQDLFEIWLNGDKLNASCESFFKENPKFEKSFKEWIDQVLVLNDLSIEVFSDFNAKLKKLPEDIRKLIWKITTFSEKNNAWISEVLTFAQNFPYTDVIDKFSDICHANFSVNEFNISAKNLQETYKGFSQLSKEHPILLPRLLGILKQDPTRFIDLMNLSTKMEPPLFKYMLNRYFANECIKDLYLSTLWSSHVEQLLKDAGLLKKFVQLMRFEKDTGVYLFSKLSSQIETLKSPLVDFLMADAEIARQFLWNDWEKPQLLILETKLKEDPKHVAQLFQIAAKYPKALQELLDNVSLGKIKINQSKISVFYSHLVSLNANPDNQSIVDRLLWLFEQGEKDFIFVELLPLVEQNPSLLGKLLDMTRGGGLSEVKQLLELRKQTPNDPLTLRLLDLTGSKNISFLKKMMELRKRNKDHALLILLSKESLGKAVSPFVLNLLVLYARGDTVLMNKFLAIAEKSKEQLTQQEKVTLELVTAGYFNLAEGLILSPNDTFWKSVISVSPHALKQSLRDLSISLAMHDGSQMKPILTAQDKEDIFTFSVALSKQKGQEKQAAEWIGRVQFLLSHEPRSLAKMTSSKEWKITLEQIVKQKDSALFIEKMLKQFPLDIDGRLDRLLRNSLPKEDAKDKSELSITKFTLALADCLVTYGGAVNTALIDKIKSRPLYKNLKTDDYNKSYLDRALEALIRPEFTERLEILDAPPARSRQSDLVHIMLEIPPEQQVIPRDAQRVVLSDLLWPLRQSKVGSCFGTSIAIQLDSSEDGLLQKLEDDIALLSNGCLVREATEPNQGTVEYPMTFEKGIFAEKFKGDQYLTRVREYVTASMAVGGSDVRSTAISEWMKLLNRHVKEFHEKLKTKQEQDEFNKIGNDIEATLKRNIDHFCQTFYFGFSHHPEANTDGAWQLVDRESGEPLGKNLAVLHNFFKNIFAKAEAQLIQQYPKNQQEIKGLAKSLNDHVQSKEFLSSFVSSWEYFGLKNKGLPGLNRKKYCHLLVNSPFVRYEGGQPLNALETYHGQKILSTKLLPMSHPLESYDDYMRRLPDVERIAAQNNPEFLKTMTSSTHAFNLKLGNLAQIKNIKLQVQDLKKKQKELLTSPCTEKLIMNVVKEYIDYMPKGLRGPFKKIAESQMKNKPCKNLREVCDLLIQISCTMTANNNAQAEAEKKLAWVINSIPSLKEQSPFNFSVCDLNWTEGISVSYGLALDEGGEMDSLSKHNGDVYTAYWSPGLPSQLTVFEHRSVMDPFSMVYYQPKT